jgi:hypothetical protein
MDAEKVETTEKIQAEPLSEEAKSAVLGDYATVCAAITQILEGKQSNMAVDEPLYVTPTTKGDPLDLDTKHTYGHIADMPTLIYFKRIRAALEHALVHNWIPSDLAPPNASELISSLVKPGRGAGGPRNGRSGGRRRGGGGRGRFGRGSRRGRGRGRGRGKDKENDEEGAED